MNQHNQHKIEMARWWQTNKWIRRIGLKELDQFNVEITPLILEWQQKVKFVLIDRQKFLSDSSKKEPDDHIKLSLPNFCDSKELANFKSRVRSRHETVNGRVTFFLILSKSPWDESLADYLHAGVPTEESVASGRSKLVDKSLEEISLTGSSVLVVKSSEKIIVSGSSKLVDKKHRTSLIVSCNSNLST